MKQVCLTMDLDWTTDDILEDTLELLDLFNVRATLFAVHPLGMLDLARKRGHEIAAHPVVDVQGLNGMSKRIEEVKAAFPLALGVRSHALFTSTFFLRQYLEAGFQYTCDFYVPDQPYLVPFRRLKKLICLPYVWEDGSHFGEPNDLQSLGLDRDGLLIYNFHPIHVFLNTISTQGYHRSRRFYQDTPALFLRRAQGVGTRDQFVGFLEWMHKHPECCSQTCGEIVKGIEDEGR